jgi:hypothetical protein
VGAWSLHDSSGSDAGYRVLVALSAPTVDGVAGGAGTGAALTLTPRTPRTPTAAGRQPRDGWSGRWVAQPLGTTATMIAVAPGAGQGAWNFAADAGATESLALVIPGDASAGAYSSTLTFTTAPPFPYACYPTRGRWAQPRSADKRPENLGSAPQQGTPAVRRVRKATGLHRSQPGCRRRRARHEASLAIVEGAAARR